MYDEDQEEYTPTNILPAIKRYKWYALVAVPLMLALAVFIIFLIPPIYKSTGRVMVETQQIPTELVESTVTAAASEQIDVIRQRVMTRENLMTIINKYPDFESATATPIEQAEILNNFRDSIEVEVASTKNGRETVAIGFDVSFKSEKPLLSQAVANDLVSLFLSENVKARTSRASETTEFLKAEADKIRKELDEIEVLVADFKRENQDALPEHLTLYTNMREDIRKRISDIEQSITSNNEQAQLLRNQLNLAKQGGVIAGADDDLQVLRTHYRQLLIRFTSEHPDVISTKQQIELLENGHDAGNSEPIYSAAEMDLKNQINSVTKRIETLEEDRSKELSKLEDVQERIIKIPQVERGFVSIRRDYAAKQQQYEEITGKLQNAEIAESLEQQRKAERFILLEPPLVPTAPAEPDRKKLVMASGVLALGFPIGIIFSIGFLDRSIRTGDQLEKLTGSAPLVEVPYIENATYKKLGSLKLIFAGGAVVLGLIIMVAIIHFLAIPLDLLFYKLVG